MIVEIRFPAPLRHVPAGARLPRNGFAAMAAKARLREVGPADLPEAARVGDATLCAFEGCLWRRPARTDGFPLGRADLVDWLASGQPDPGGLHADLARHFHRGPLLGSLLGGAPSRGDASLASRQVLYDGRPRASARAVRLVESEILLAGGEPYVRCRPVTVLARPNRKAPLAPAPCLAPGHWRAFSYIPYGDPGAEQDWESAGYAFRADRPAEAMDFARVGGPAPDLAFPDGLAGDDDLALMANALPEFLLGEAHAVLGAHRARPVGTEADAQAVEARSAALLPAAVEGSVGGVPEADVPEILERCLALSRAIQALAGPLWSATRLPTLDRYLTDHALPRVAPFAQDDLDAVAALAP